MSLSGREVWLIDGPDGPMACVKISDVNKNPIGLIRGGLSLDPRANGRRVGC